MGKLPKPRASGEVTYYFDNLISRFSRCRKKLKIREKPGGRAGLRKFARAMRSMFGSVRAARALQDVSMCLLLGR